MAPPTHETLTQLQKLRESLPPATKQNEDLREQLLAESKRLYLSLEGPENIVARLSFAIWEPVVCQIASDLGLFDALEKFSGPCSTASLAKQTNSDPGLLSRILRALAGFGAIDEVGVDSYSSTIVSKTLTVDVNKAAIEASSQFLASGWMKTPAYLKQNGYQNPVHPSETALAMAYGKPEGAEVWELLCQTPHEKALGLYISTFNKGHGEWTDIYPVEERLAPGADTSPDAVMMVDVGGALGQQAVLLKEKYPQLPGRYVVQDLSVLPPESDRVPGLEYVKHDFMTEQPIKGARLYYLRYVMHDWSFDRDVAILTHLRNAMKPGYSRLVINEWIVPARGASAFVASQDLNMLSSCGGMERTEALHREYIAAAGLKVTNIYYPTDKLGLGVIEAEVA